MISAVSVLVGMSALFATITDTSAGWSGSAVLANSAESEPRGRSLIRESWPV